MIAVWFAPSFEAAVHYINGFTVIDRQDEMLPEIMAEKARREAIRSRAFHKARYLQGETDDIFS